MTSDEIRETAIHASEEWAAVIGLRGYESMTLAQAYRDGFKAGAGYERASEAEGRLVEILAILDGQTDESR